MSTRAGYGIQLAIFGTLVLTLDTLFMRLSGMSGLEMTAWRGLCMGFVLIALWRFQARDASREFRTITTRAGATIIACQFFNTLFFCLGIAIAPVAIVLLGLSTVPVFAALFAWFILGERTSALTWVAIGLVIVGIGLAVSGKTEGGMRFDPATVAGALFGLGVAVVLALNFVTLRARPDLPIPLLIGCGALIVGVLSSALTGPQAMMQGTIWPMIVTGAVILPVSFVALSVAARHTHASNVSLLMLMETVLAPAWVWLVIGETPTLRMILGGAIVIVSLAFYLLLLRREEQSGN